MRTLKKLAVATILALSLSGLAVGSLGLLQPATEVVADSGNQRGDYDAG